MTLNRGEAITLATVYNTSSANGAWRVEALGRMRSDPAVAGTSEVEGECAYYTTTQRQGQMLNLSSTDHLTTT